MYTFDKQLKGTTFEAAILRTKEALSAQGFGVLTEIDVQKTMKTKLDADMLGYTILGACNPKMAFEAIKLEPRAGAMLPCNVIVREQADGIIEVSAIDPVQSMAAINNEALRTLAGRVKDMLSKVVSAL